MGDQNRTDEEVFGEDINKVRQLLGGCAIALIHHRSYLSDLLDVHTFRSFTENRQILEEICYWFTNPSYVFSFESDTLSDIVNLLKAFLKRAINKNVYNGIKLIEKRGEGVAATYTR